MKHVLLGMMLAALGCSGAPPSEACGLKSTKPELTDGTLEATRDGASYRSDSGIRGYRLLSGRTNIAAGILDLQIGKDQDGNSVDTLINDGKFPICIPLNDQADGTTYASVTGGGTFLTGGTNTGVVAILGKDGEQLYGRFEFSAKDPNGSSTTRFDDGVFRLGPR